MKKTFNLIVLSLLLLLLNLAQAVRPSIQYVYSPSGHLLEEQMPNGNVIHHDYDGLGRKTESRDQHGLLGKYRVKTSVQATVSVVFCMTCVQKLAVLSCLLAVHVLKC